MKLKVNKHTLALIVWIVAIAALLAGVAAVILRVVRYGSAATVETAPEPPAVEEAAPESPYIEGLARNV